MDVVHILQKISDTHVGKLPLMWCDLNSWQWPIALNDVKPMWWIDIVKDRDRKHEVITPLMAFIEGSVGIPACLEAWENVRMKRQYKIVEPVK